MSALYQLHYQGVAGDGHGAMYIGNGKLVGVDITGARYHGTYAEKDGQLVGQCTLSANGGQLVTGQDAPPGAQIPIHFSLPQNFGGGHPVSVSVAGQPVFVSFSKIGDI